VGEGKPNGELSPTLNRDALQADLDQLVNDGVLSKSSGFGKPDQAATHVLEIIAPLSRTHGFELIGHIFKGSTGQYHYTLPQIGGATSANLRLGWIGY